MTSRLHTMGHRALTSVWAPSACPVLKKSPRNLQTLTWLLCCAQFDHTCDTFGGDSGSPLWLYDPTDDSHKVGGNLMRCIACKPLTLVV